VKEVECQIEVDAVGEYEFAGKLNVLIGGNREGCRIETELLQIDVCSNQAQEYETLLDLGPQNLAIEEDHFRDAVVQLLNKLWDSGVSTKVFHEFSKPLPHNGEKKC